MWSAWFNRVKTQFAAVTSDATIKFEDGRRLAYANERLENNVLLAADSSSKPLAPTAPSPVRVDSLGVAHSSCAAH